MQTKGMVAFAVAAWIAAWSRPGGATPEPRTIVAAFAIDRDEARLVAYTHRERAARGEPPADPAAPIRLEVTLLGRAAAPAFVTHLEPRGLCFEHGPGAPDHVAGDTILVHQDTFLVELPDLPGYDRIEVAVLEGDRDVPERRVLGAAPLDPALLSGSTADKLATPGTVHWPEEYGDLDRYTVYGDEAEAGRRINLVIVPDGYVYAEKARMQTHATNMVNFFRSKTPYAEHDLFINYILVYAYSTESTTDECDCGVVKDTAMNTRFPDQGYPCGDSGNRCLYYGTGNGGPNCDPTTTSANIVAAELRAPAHDLTVVMVNTTRYGGCGGSRAVYSAANSSATEVAVHEVGHSLAGLADEYDGSASCGSGSGPNVSTDPTNGAWPEWIADIGAPRQGAQYYNQCIYRPESSCDMRTLGPPFCKVCNQRWALTFFGHGRVRPTAPIESQNPGVGVAAFVGQSVPFSVATRLAAGANVTNDFTWSLQAPGAPGPVVVATGVSAYNHIFPAPGTYTLSCQVVADTNFVKPAKNGGNVDMAWWSVVVSAVCDPGPSFRGARGAVDRDSCLRSGIEVSWDPAVFGPSGGTYEVWRDATLVASGLSASPFMDAPGDGALHSYRVAAVSDDCSLRDGNGVSVDAADGVGAAPSAAGNTLRAVRSGMDVVFRWADDPTATGYEIGRAAPRDFSGPVTIVGGAASGTPGVVAVSAIPGTGLSIYRLRQTACGLASSW